MTLAMVKALCHRLMYPDTYDPEDFYEWYSDDFTDFEEAEEYYNEHGGW